MPDTTPNLSTEPEPAPSPQPSDAAGEPSTGVPKGRLAAIAVVVVGLFVAIKFLPIQDWTDRLGAYVETLGVWGPIVFGLVYVAAAVALVPASALTLAAGAIFGPLLGFIIVSIASTTSAALSLLIGRYLAREKVEALAKNSPKFQAVDRAVAKGGWKIVAMLRLSPAIPFNLQNYFYGLTSIPFWKCVLTSWLAMMPGTFLYVYLGYIGKSAVSDASSGSADAGRWALLAVGLLATVAVTVYLTKLAKKELAEQTELDDGPDA